MSRFACRARECTWTPSGEHAAGDELRAHALEQGHGLCGCCGYSLTEHEPATCQGCVTAAGEHLTAIALMYDELPSRLGHLRSPSYDNDRPAAADGRPLPGGDVLVLLGKGSEGWAEDGTTSKDGDPISVAYELGFWEQDWRETRDDPAEWDRRVLSARAETGRAVIYLQAGLRWAGNCHPAFPEFAADVRKIAGVLERATSRHRHAPKANANCLDCGGVLRRRITKDGLEEDEVTCDQCGRQYSEAAYRMAVKAAVEAGSRMEVAGETYATPAVVAAIVERPERTIRNWQAQDLIRREVRNGVIYVNLQDARTLSDEKARRPRACA